MSIVIPEPIFSITTDSNWCRMAEATILFMGEPIAYVGGSSSEDTCREAAEAVLARAFAPIIEAIAADSDTDPISRFDVEYDSGDRPVTKRSREDYPRHWPNHLS